MPELLRSMKDVVRKAVRLMGYELVRDEGGRAHSSPEPLRRGDASSREPIPLLDDLPDDELLRLNELLPWAAFVVDSHGRRFGRPYSPVKRNQPQPLLDPRIAAWNELRPLAGQSVLEVGCFEGIHTLALCRLGAEVTAIDARIENVVKTLARCALFDAWPRVLRWDLDGPPPAGVELGWERVLHVGVLYHLSDPLSHLRELAKWTRQGMLLDTHVAPPGEALQELRSGAHRVRCWAYREKGREAPFAGMQAIARWIVEEDLIATLETFGFEVDVVERRSERNGPRVLIHAWRRTTA